MKGQSDSINISTIEIYASKSVNSGQEIIVSKNVINLSQLLNQKNSIYIKSYGRGSAATLSIRGGSSNQNIVLWEDIPINNPMLGLSDLSLINPLLFNEMRINKGGQSVYGGSGGISGSLALRNKSKDDTSITVINGLGSFGYREHGLLTQLKARSLNWSSRLVYNRSDNDFGYTVSTINRDQTNAYFRSLGWVQKLTYDISHYHQLSLDTWVNDSYREIPPLTTQTRSDDFQIDKNYRAAIGYRYTKNRVTTELKWAYLNEANDFFQPLNRYEFKNRFRKYFGYSQIKFLTTATTYSIKIEYSDIKGSTSQYALTDEQQRRYALSGGVKKIYDNLTVQVDGRQEWNQGKSSGFSPALQLTYRYRDIEISSQLSREFRFPTLNELFWRPSSTISVEPEYGWDQSLELSYSHKKSFGVTWAPFHRLINNWVLWTPDGGSSFMAQNLAKVRSYGMELSTHKSWSQRKVKTTISGNYNYTRSTNLVAFDLPKIDEGSQLLYIPIHQAGLRIDQRYRDWGWHVSSNYTGSVNGINEEVPGFLLLDGAITKTIGKQLSGSLTLSLENILSKSYMVTERRPMPGRTLNVRWITTFNKNK